MGGHSMCDSCPDPLEDGARLCTLAKELKLAVDAAQLHTDDSRTIFHALSNMSLVLMNLVAFGRLYPHMQPSLSADLSRIVRSCGRATEAACLAVYRWLHFSRVRQVMTSSTLCQLFKQLHQLLTGEHAKLLIRAKGVEQHLQRASVLSLSEVHKCVRGSVECCRDIHALGLRLQTLNDCFQAAVHTRMIAAVALKRHAPAGQNLEGALAQDGAPSRCAAWSPDGRMLATGTTSGTTVALWDGLTGELLREVDVGKCTLSIVWEADASTLTTGFLGGGGARWDVVSGACVAGACEELEAPKERPWSASTSSPDGHMFVSSVTSVPKLWDASTGDFLRIFEGHKDCKDRRFVFAWSPDSRTLAIVSHGYRMQSIASLHAIPHARGHTSTLPNASSGLSLGL